ncbi:hypothetical protein V8E54_006085 [Elaphomyces granulatus]
MYRKLPGGHFSRLEKGVVRLRPRPKGKRRRTTTPTKGEAVPLRKSLTSYPHWPPSTYEEAVAQLRSLIGESFPHRMYLADCWLTSLYMKLAAGSEGVEKMISLVQQSCGSLHQSAERRVANVVDCRMICEPILKAQGTANGSSCLCGCGRHREMCPIHGQAPLYHCFN